jgi:hypothetical protein
VSEPKRRRSRKRDNAGSSPASWKKHRLLERVAQAQFGAYSYTHPHERYLIIDMHAGTGEGVPLPQLDMFEETPSPTTVQIAMKLRMMYGQCDVVLCESHPERRQRLREHFPRALILADHAEVPSVIQPYHRWALIFNDPDGYSEHGIETMEELAKMLKCDWLIVFNRGALNQLLGMAEVPEKPDAPNVVGVRRSRAKYAWMDDHTAWAGRLGAAHMAQYPLVPASSRFRYHLFVLSHTLSDVLHRAPWRILL